MAIKNKFEHPLNTTEDEITDFASRKVWMWNLDVSADDLWRLKDLVKSEYSQAK